MIFRVTTRLRRSYSLVVRGSECPAKYCTFSSETPWVSRSVTVRTLNEWGELRLDKPASFRRRLTSSQTVLRSIGRAVSV